MPWAAPRLSASSPTFACCVTNVSVVRSVAFGVNVKCPMTDRSLVSWSTGSGCPPERRPALAARLTSCDRDQCADKAALLRPGDSAPARTNEPSVNDRSSATGSALAVLGVIANLDGMKKPSSTPMRWLPSSGCQPTTGPGAFCDTSLAMRVTSIDAAPTTSGNTIGVPGRSMLVVSRSANLNVVSAADVPCTPIFAVRPTSNPPASNSLLMICGAVVSSHPYAERDEGSGLSCGASDAGSCGSRAERRKSQRRSADCCT